MSASSTTAVDVRRYIRRTAISSLFNSGSSALSTALLLPLVIRQIGMETYGLWAVLGIFIGVSSALDLGIWKSLVYLLPKAMHTRDELISTAVTLCMLTACAFALIVTILLRLDIPLFGSAVRQAHLEVWVAASGVTIVALCLLTNLTRGMLESSYRGHFVNIGYAVLTLSLYAVPATISHWTRDPRPLIVGSVVVYASILAGHSVLAFRVRKVRFVRPTIYVARSILRFGLRSFAADAPSIVLGPTLLYLFVFFTADAAQFGTFDISLRIATLAGTTLGLLSTPFFALAANASDVQRTDVMRTATKFLRITVAAAIGGWCVFLVAGRWLLNVFFGAADARVFETSVVILLGTASMAAFEPIARVQMGMGRLHRLFWVRLSMLITALAGIAALSMLPLLQRFSISAAMGFGVAACGLFRILMIDRKP